MQAAFTLKPTAAPAFDWRVLIMARGEVILLVTQRGGRTAVTSFVGGSSSRPIFAYFATDELAARDFDVTCRDVRRQGWDVFHKGAPLVG